MKKIGVFHAFPSEIYLKKAYLFFDEIQTSKKFIKTSFDSVNWKNYSNIRHENPKLILDRIDTLEGIGILKIKEDIENRILPLVGSFDSKQIKHILSNGKSDYDDSVIEYFDSLVKLQENYGIQIYGESIVDQINRRPSTHFIGSSVFSILGSKRVDSKKENSSTSMFADRNFLTGTELYSRIASSLLNSYFRDNHYCALVSGNTFTSRNNFSGLDFKKSEVIRLVINKFPVPAENISWEKIINFKNDSRSMRKLLNLRVWIEEISSKEPDLSYVDDKLQQLIFEYEEKLKLHKIEFIPSAFEAFLIPLLETIEGIATLKLSKAGKSLFSFNRKRIEMLKSESQLMNKEVAYIGSMKDLYR